MARPPTLHERTHIGVAQWGFISKAKLQHLIGPERFEQLHLQDVMFQEQQRMHQARAMHRCSCCDNSDVFAEGDMCRRCERATEDQYLERLYPNCECEGDER